MKRTVICIALLALMAVMGIYLQVRTEKVTAEIYDRLERLPQMSEPEERTREATDISADWESFCARNIFLTNSEGASEVSKALVHIVSEVRTGEGDITEDCIDAQLLVDIYRRSCEPSWDNIF